jgi:alkanesulfonate monooxygenase SsuD/methylene tetrahydromethanopterin reductase-like flavin-dependent oxidoreductase (luciferase family)
MNDSSDERRLRFHLKVTGNDGYVPHPQLSGRNSNYIDLSAEDYSVPLLAQEAMRRALSNLEMGERLGFDSVAVMEQRAPAIYPSSTVMASWLLAKSQRIHVGALGPVSATYLNPLKIAEEIAMLDVMSGGRVYFAFPMGIGPAYFQMGANPTTARRRHAESVALVLRALTEPGPFEHRGEFFDLPYVNLFPQPLRRPPDSWIPASGSRESQIEAARGHHTYMLFLNGRAGVKRNAEAFRQVARDEFGYEPPPRQLALVIYVYVAETDAQARKEFEPHLLWFHQNVLGGTFEEYVPPGSTTVGSLKKRLDASSGFQSRPETLSYEDLLREGLAIVGSPETVTAELERYVDEVGAGQIVVYADGTAPEWMVHKSMDLFAREVMPKFRPPGGRPFWADERPAGFETISEAGARLPAPPVRPLTRMGDGELVDTYTAHIDELRVPVGPEELERHRRGGG